jgi:iron(III) transport system substrate-binding protein
VTIYSGRTENLIGPILDDFAEETGISVEVRYGDSADLALLIEQEGGNPRADVFLSQSPGAVGFLQERDLLAPLDPDVLTQVPEGFRDPSGEWVGFSGRQRVLVYDSDALTEADLPSSVFDLTDEEWKGRVGIAPSNGSFQDFVTAMRVSEGDDVAADFLAGLDANDAVTYPNNNAIVAAVGRGEVDVGLVNHYYNFRFLEEDPGHPGLNHLFAADDPGSVFIVTGAALTQGAVDDPNAARLIEFLLEADAQRYFADETFEYPVAAGVEPAAAVPPVDLSTVQAIDYSALGGGLARTRELISDAGLAG